MHGQPTSSHHNNTTKRSNSFFSSIHHLLSVDLRLAWVFRRPSPNHFCNFDELDLVQDSHSYCKCMQHSVTSRDKTVGIGVPWSLGFLHSFSPSSMILPEPWWGGVETAHLGPSPQVLHFSTVTSDQCLHYLLPLPQRCFFNQGWELQRSTEVYSALKNKEIMNKRFG